MSELVRARLSAPGPKRILALDGGGTRGIITIQFLKRIEALLGERFVAQGYYQRPDQFRLSHYFDLIGGTSVGALIAAQLAQGDDVSVVERRFHEWGPTVFKKSWLRNRYINTTFAAKALKSRLIDVFGDCQLDDPRFKTGLVVVTKRADTGSVWPIFNNPKSKYWNSDSGIPNRNYLVREVLRASSAAPTYFRRARIVIAAPELGTNQKPEVGYFVDGAVSPHNNPSLQLFMMARLTGYNMGGGEPGREVAWPLGEENLLLINVGTGMHASQVAPGWPLGEAVANLTSMIGDNEQLVLTMMQGMSNPRDPWHIDGELGTLKTDDFVERPTLAFQRYDMPLELKWLAEVGRRGKPIDEDKISGRRRGHHLLAALRSLGPAPLTPRLFGPMRELIAPETMAKLAELAAAAALDQVDDADFPNAFDRVVIQPAGPGP